MQVIYVDLLHKGSAMQSFDDANEWYLNNSCQISNISRSLVENKFVDLADVVGASPASAAPTTSSFST